MNWFLILKLVKNKYRRSAHQQRKSLSDEEHLTLSLTIQENFLRSISLGGTQNIALYMPANNEVSLELLNKEADKYLTKYRFLLSSPINNYSLLDLKLTVSLP